MLNWDSSFFNVEVEDVLKDKSKVGRDISQRIQSLEINEELGQGITGSLNILDSEYHTISYMMRMGRRIKIKWGYKNNDFSGTDAYSKQKNNKEIFSKGLMQRYIEGFIRNPSGNASENGTVMYNCNFITLLGIGATNKIYGRRGMTKLDVVREVFQKMEVVETYIKFARQREPVGGDTAIRQDSVSDFRFLNTLALEWRCMFRIAMNKDGKQIGLFCDYHEDSIVENFFKSTMNCLGDTVLMEYKLGKANVKSYSWSQSDSGNGSGDNARITMVNGQPQITRTVARTETVEVYKLDVNKIRKEMMDRAGDPSAIVSHLNKLMEYNTMDELVEKGYYKRATETTAPQGAGFSLDMECIGNPLCTAPAKIMFGQGFPDLFRASNKKMRFFVQSVSHKISSSGYMMSIKISDAFGGSLIR